MKESNQHKMGRWFPYSGNDSEDDEHTVDGNTRIPKGSCDVREPVVTLADIHHV